MSFPGAGSNIVFGDYGVVNQAAGTDPILGTGNVTSISTVRSDGGLNTIVTGSGGDFILGGGGSNEGGLSFGDSGGGPGAGDDGGEADSGPQCTGTLCNQSMADDCAGNGMPYTSISGVVYDPAGALPLYDVYVYIPSSTPDDIDPRNALKPFAVGGRMVSRRPCE